MQFIMVFKKGHIVTEEMREKMSRAKVGKYIGDKNPFWKGDNITYATLHGWLKRHMPKPEYCELCRLTPPDTIACITGIYSRDLSNFRWFCWECHNMYDGASDRVIDVGKN